MAKPDIAISVGLLGVKSLQKSLGRADSEIKSFEKKIKTALAAVGFGALAKSAIDSASQMEQLNIQFETFLGSAAAANKSLKEIEQFAASTPFQFPDLADASRMLLAFNIEQDKLLPTLKSLGDLAAGTGNNIGELAEIYGKARVQGRLFAEDVNQFTGRGIPIISELAKQFGIAESEVKKLVEQGKVGFPELERAFKDLTSEGGKFFNLTDKLSQSTSGRLSTLKDNFEKLLRSAGEKVLPIISDAADALTKSIQRVFFGMKEVEGGSTALDTAFRILKGAFDIVIEAGKLVIGVLKGIFNAFAAVAKAIKNTFGSLNEEVGKFNADVGRRMEPIFYDVQRAVGAADGQMKAFRKEVEVTGLSIKNTHSKNVNIATEAFIKWWKETREAKIQQSLLNEEIDKTNENGKGLGEAAKFAAGSLGFYNEKLSELNTKLEKSASIAKRSSLREEIAGINKEISQIENEESFLKLTEFLSKFGDEEVKGVNVNTILPNNEEIRTSGQSVIDNLNRVQEEAAKTKNVLKESLIEPMKEIGKSALIDLAGGLGKAFGEAIVGTKKLGESLRDLALEIIQTASRAAGLALISSAAAPAALATFPANLGLIAAGLALVGLSGLIGGLSGGFGSGGDSSNIPGPESVASAPRALGLGGLSEDSVFNQQSFNIDLSLAVDGDDLGVIIENQTVNRGRRRGD